MSVSIQKVDVGTALSDELVQFIENCSWNEVKAHLIETIKNNSLPEVEPWVSSVFVTEEYRGHRISGKLIAYANEYLGRLGFHKSFIPSEYVGLYERYGYHYVTDITNCAWRIRASL